MHYNKIKFLKDFPSSTREWRNSIYVFNKHILNKIPTLSYLAINIIKSYFDVYNLILEKKIKRKKRISLRLKRLSSNKIFLSNGEFKHTNNKVVITIYTFNRQKSNLKFKFIKNYLKIIKFLRNKLILKLRKTSHKKFLVLKDKNLIINTNSIKYLIIFYKKLLKKRMFKLKKYIYYKQLMFLNKSKYNYIFLHHLKNQLEFFFNKNIEFNIVDMKRFYTNSDIFTTVITAKITKNRRKLSKILNILKKKVKIKKSLFGLSTKNIKVKNNINLLKSYIFYRLKYKNVSGFKFEAIGRLTRRYTASRSKYVFTYKGNLANIDSSLKGLSSVILKGNLKSNIQYTKLSSKTRIGSFGVKGWISGN